MSAMCCTVHLSSTYCTVCFLIPQSGCQLTCSQPESNQLTARVYG